MKRNFRSLMLPKLTSLRTGRHAKHKTDRTPRRGVPSAASPAHGDLDGFPTCCKSTSPLVCLRDNKVDASGGNRRFRDGRVASRGRTPTACCVAPFELALPGSELLAERVVDLRLDRDRLSDAKVAGRGDQHNSKCPSGSRPAPARRR